MLDSSAAAVEVAWRRTKLYSETMASISRRCAGLKSNGSDMPNTLRSFVDADDIYMLVILLVILLGRLRRVHMAGNDSEGGK